MAKISVVIPTYNRENCVTESVKSVLAQSHKDIEVIVVDDGSTDGTRNVIESINDGRVSYFYKENGGKANARNYGLEKATGRYMFFLDSDDLWPEHFVESMHDLLEEQQDYDIAYGRVILEYPDGTRKEISRKDRSVSGRITPFLFGKGPALFPSSVCFRASCFDAFRWNENMKRSEDAELFLRISTKCRFLYNPAAWVIKREQNDSSFCKFSPLHFTGSVWVATAMKQFIKGYGYVYVPRKKAAQKISKLFHKAARACISNRYRQASLLCICEAIKAWPYNWRHYWLLLRSLAINKNNDKLPGWTLPA